MTTSLAVLLVEDSESDAQLIVRLLKKAGYDVVSEQVETAEQMRAALGKRAWDIVISDYSLPQFDGRAALTLLRETGQDIPFIVVSGTIGEETAVAMMKAGAHDYLLKGNLARLTPAVERELAQAETRRERKRAEAELAARNEELKAMTQQLWQTAKLATMGELAASIAHELNNPLATVSLRVEDLLAGIPPDDPRRQALEVIEQEVERMGLLVSNLLQFSRRGAQQISTLDVRDEIAKTLELVHYLLRQRRIAVVPDFAPDAPMIQADRQQLRQLFLNLFTNASDAMPEGGTLTIRVYVQKAEGGRQKAEAVLALPSADRRLPSVCIEVADTGVGIVPDDLPKVMEPFFTTKPEGKGTGLGLAICRRVVQEHGGTLDITSEGVPGSGTTVRLTLPGKNGSNGNFLNAP